MLMTLDGGETKAIKQGVTARHDFLDTWLHLSMARASSAESRLASPSPLKIGDVPSGRAAARVKDTVGTATQAARRWYVCPR